MVYNAMTRQLKAGIVEQVEAVAARQWHSKNISAATDTDTTEEDAVISMQFPPRLHDKDQEEKEKQQSVINCKRAVLVCGWP
jgi:hypothetical protein